MFKYHNFTSTFTLNDEENISFLPLVFIVAVAIAVAELMSLPLRSLFKLGSKIVGKLGRARSRTV